MLWLRLINQYSLEHEFYRYVNLIRLIFNGVSIVWQCNTFLLLENMLLMYIE